MICPVAQYNWLLTEEPKLRLFVSEISHTHPCPHSEPSKGEYCCCFLPLCKLSSPLNTILGWDLPFCALSHLSPISGHRGCVRSGEGEVRGANTLGDVRLVENVTVQPFWRFSLEHRAACAPASAFQERLQGRGTALPSPLCSAVPLPRHGGKGSPRTWDAYKLLIVFLSEASPNSLAFPKQKQIWIAELARKTNSNPVLSENTARCHE